MGLKFSWGPHFFEHAERDSERALKKDASCPSNVTGSRWARKRYDEKSRARLEAARAAQKRGALFWRYF